MREMKGLKMFCKDETAAASVEYGLLIAFIAMALVGTVHLLGPIVGGCFTRFTDHFP